MNKFDPIQGRGKNLFYFPWVAPMAIQSLTASRSGHWVKFIIDKSKLFRISI